MISCFGWCFLQLVGINKALTHEIEILTSNSEQAKIRLQLLIQWWEEFYGNHSDVVSWLDEAETNLSQLLARFRSSQPPRVSPSEILQDMKVRTCDHINAGGHVMVM